MICFWVLMDFNPRKESMFVSVDISKTSCVQERNGPQTGACCRWPHLSGWRSQRAAKLVWRRGGGGGGGKFVFLFVGPKWGRVPAGGYKNRPRGPTGGLATVMVSRCGPATMMNEPKLHSIRPRVRRCGDNGTWPPQRGADPRHSSQQFGLISINSAPIHHSPQETQTNCQL